MNFIESPGARIQNTTFNIEPKSILSPATRNC